MTHVLYEHVLGQSNCQARMMYDISNYVNLIQLMYLPIIKTIKVSKRIIFKFL